MSPSQNPEKRISELTVAEFQALMRETMQEMLDQVQAMIEKLEAQLPDKQLRTEAAAEQVTKALEME